MAVPAGRMLETIKVQRAERSFDGKNYDGNSSGEEYEMQHEKRLRHSVVDDCASGKARKSFNRSRLVALQPRAGDTITVVATADLHRHHNDAYIANSSLNLAQWFATPLAPHTMGAGGSREGDVDVVLITSLA